MRLVPRGAGALGQRIGETVLAPVRDKALPGQNEPKTKPAAGVDEHDRLAAELSAVRSEVAALRHSVDAYLSEIKTTQTHVAELLEQWQSAGARPKATSGKPTSKINSATSVEALADNLPAAVINTIRRARSEHLTMLQEANLRQLAGVVAHLDAARIPGLIIEAGTARGGSAIVLASAKPAGRKLRVYDVFGMIPEPSDKDGDDVHQRYRTIAAGKASGPKGEIYYGYRDDLYTEVEQSFARLGYPIEEHDVELIKGLFADTIQVDEPVAFAHLDGDWYESTMTCLERIAPHLSRGGRLVIDD